MSYEDQADLSTDVPFQRRTGAALAEEARVHPEDAFAQAVLRDPSEATGRFMPLLATAPGFGDTYATGGSKAITDGALLAAIQADWDTVAALYPPAEIA